ncbi:hypothetical protein [Azospirillum picis]|uniref:Uncharacterized protein n=1 Tax=Azospirillum picis TaxID=488438 RepID=A0ABU0MGP6_9PROT|nr:hypothetical protein [Azospirillum picis]MBP2298370.1 hypothetical protein [Azospirillum picis]MDQ0532581.1 hypothetical protein [Azospirillum picis]
MDKFDDSEPADSQIALWTRIALAILLVGLLLCGVSLYLLAEA